MPADGFTVSGKTHAAFFHAARMRKSDVYRANWFFFAAAARAGNPRDAHAERASHAAADAVGQSLCYFAAHRALRLNKLRGHMRPRSFQIVAVTNHAAQKVGRAARYAGQPLRQ